MSISECPELFVSMMGTHGLSVKNKMSNKLHAVQQAQPLASGALALEH